MFDEDADGEEWKDGCDDRLGLILRIGELEGELRRLRRPLLYRACSRIAMWLRRRDWLIWNRVVKIDARMWDTPRRSRDIMPLINGKPPETMDAAWLVSFCGLGCVGGYATYTQGGKTRAFCPPREAIRWGKISVVNSERNTNV